MGFNVTVTMGLKVQHSESTYDYR